MPKLDVFEEVHVALDAMPQNARATVEAVLDLHHEYNGGCVECSRKAAVTNWPAGAVNFPCRTVTRILEVSRAGV